MHQIQLQSTTNGCLQCTTGWTIDPPACCIGLASSFQLEGVVNGHPQQAGEDKGTGEPLFVGHNDVLCNAQEQAGLGGKVGAILRQEVAQQAAAVGLGCGAADDDRSR